jgi:hypothetical protein
MRILAILAFCLMPFSYSFAADYAPAGKPVQSSWLDDMGCDWGLGADRDSVLGEENIVDDVFNGAFGWKDELTDDDRFSMPVNFGAYHWWLIDTAGIGNGGYGAAGLRGTYAWYTLISPSYELDDDRSIGGYIFFLGRDGDNYRSFYSRKFWFLDGYVSFTDSEFGTLKAGLVRTKFGLENYLGFFGSAPYFDGFIYDSDYGFSWERTTEFSDDVSLETVLQYFIHDGEWNGSLANHDSESVVGLSERNTFVARVAPTFKLSGGGTLTAGMAALAGEIDSDVPGFASGHRAAWGAHFDYEKDRWQLRGQILQLFGKVVPTRFASGGPSNRITSFTTEAGYTVGPITYRGMFTQSHDSNPNGRQTIWSAGAVVKVTPSVNLYLEYSDFTVDGHATSGDFPIIQGVQTVVHWQF